jgi:putative transposase
VSGFVYLAVILDLYSRKVVGWSISKRIDAKLVVGAQVLEDNGFKPSMSRKGNPYDNAALETFIKTLKYEEVYLSDYETCEDVVKDCRGLSRRSTTINGGIHLWAT